MSVFVSSVREDELDFLVFDRVVPKVDGESVANKFSCAFCETTAADDYEYVQQLFHRTVREVRKERERAAASNVIDEEPSVTAVHNTANSNVPLSSSSSSSTSSIHFSNFNEGEKASSPNIPLPPPMPATLAHRAAKTAKTEPQTPVHTPPTGSPLTTAVKTGSTTTLSSTASGPPLPPPSTTTAKRTPSKTSVFSKIFKN